MNNKSQIFEFKTSYFNFFVMGLLFLGPSLILLGALLFLYFEKLDFLNILYIDSKISSIIFLLIVVTLCHAFYRMLFEVIKISISHDSITIRKIFYRININNDEIDKVLFYWIGYRGFFNRKKEYSSMKIFLKNKKKYRFGILAISDDDNEKLLSYFKSNFQVDVFRVL